MKKLVKAIKYQFSAEAMFIRDLAKVIQGCRPAMVKMVINGHPSYEYYEPSPYIRCVEYLKNIDEAESSEFFDTLMELEEELAIAMLSKVRGAA